MTRPIDINVLLDKIGDGSGKSPTAKDNDAKPRFLSRVERSNLLQKGEQSSDIPFSTSEEDYRPIIDLQRPKRSRFEEDAEVTDNGATNLNHRGNTQLSSVPHTKRAKFKFQWDQSEDTLAGYEPIVSLSTRKLLERDNRSSRTKSDILEESYMGKHWREKMLNEMNERDWKILKEDFQISTRGKSVQHPMRNWNELKLIPSELLDIITEKLGFETPTPIQRISIPNVLKDRDFLGVASTGSGKTLAFLVPIFIKLMKSPVRPRSIKVLEGPKALVLVPTRELAQQIRTEAVRLASFLSKELSNFTATAIVGGHSLQEVTNNLVGGCDLLIATPGKLIESLDNHLVPINKVSTLVLDESDKMIDLGFEEQLSDILARLDVKRTLSAIKLQTLMFTATLVPSIERLASRYLHNPVHATIGGSEGYVPLIKQLVEYVPGEDAGLRGIKGLLNSREYKPPIIIFINYKSTADWLAQQLQKQTTFKVTVLHGSKHQEQREHSLRLLRSGRAQVMIATNVAARGLDVPNVSLVINFQMSKKFEDYVHRIGRTGRAGAYGTAITYISGTESGKVINELYKYVRDHDPTGENQFDKRVSDLYGLGGEQFEDIIY